MGDDNPLNHWMYEKDEYSFDLSRKMAKFLKLWDGVHVLLENRSEVGNTTIPDKYGSRLGSDHVYSDYTPAHLHHNWRFNNIYEEAKKYEDNPNYDPKKHSKQ